MIVYVRCTENMHESKANLTDGVIVGYNAGSYGVAGQNVIDRGYSGPGCCVICDK